MRPGPARSAPLLRANHGSPWRRQAWALAWGIITPREEYLSSGEYKRQRRALRLAVIGDIPPTQAFRKLSRSALIVSASVGHRARVGRRRAGTAGRGDRADAGKPRRASCNAPASRVHVFPRLVRRDPTRNRDTGEALGAVTEAFEVMRTTGQRMYEAELHRLKGELLLQVADGNAAEAEACFREALVIASRQQAKSLELRAAVSAARLWERQGKKNEARDVLAPIYDWFTEGFDTADLRDAKELLDALV